MKPKFKYLIGDIIRFEYEVRREIVRSDGAIKNEIMKRDFKIPHIVVRDRYYMHDVPKYSIAVFSNGKFNYMNMNCNELDIDRIATHIELKEEG